MKRFGVLEYQRAFRFTSLNNKRATILDRITPIPNPHPPPPLPLPTKSRTKPREGQKRAIFPSLIWGEGV